MKRPYWAAFKRGVSAGTIKPLLDDRGELRPLYNSKRRMFRNDPGVDFPQRDFDRVLSRLVPGFSVGRSRVVQATWAAVYAAAAAAILFVVPQPRLWVVALAVPVPFFIIIAMTNRRWFWGFDPREVAAAMVAEGRCASCAYFLGRIPLAADGCTVCPECGAAWRLPDKSAG